MNLEISKKGLAIGLPNLEGGSSEVQMSKELKNNFLRQSRTTEQRVFVGILIEEARRLNVSAEIQEEAVLFYGSRQARVDVLLLKMGLAIEIDGNAHFSERVMKVDTFKEENVMKELGLTVERFSNEEVMSPALRARTRARISGLLRIELASGLRSTIRSKIRYHRQKNTKSISQFGVGYFSYSRWKKLKSSIVRARRPPS